MEVNRGEAEKCRDIGAEALRSRNYTRAEKFLKKSLRLYPLPGVTGLLSQAETKLKEEGANKSNGASSNTNNTTSATRQSRSNGAASSSNGASGGIERGYNNDQVSIVSQILKSKDDGSGGIKPHYRVLGVSVDANESQLKKAYRKLALKVHPDKNSAPGADEAFKAVGLAYATLSDSEKRNIYDRYGEEDPDNRGGGGGGGMHPGFRRNGREPSPEDIFNMFFGGGMGGGGFGGPNVRVYSTGFGGQGFQRPRQRQAQQGNQQGNEQPPQAGFGQLLQMLPILLIFLMSFFGAPIDDGTGPTGGSKYFSLTHSPPFIHPLQTKITTVKDIPFFVTEKFLRSLHRDRYQLGQVEKLVEKSYERFLRGECRNQQTYKNQLENQARYARGRGLTQADRERELKKAQAFELSRCDELRELFPHSR